MRYPHGRKWATSRYRGSYYLVDPGSCYFCDRREGCDRTGCRCEFVPARRKPRPAHVRADVWPGWRMLGLAHVRAGACPGWRMPRASPLPARPARAQPVRLIRSHLTRWPLQPHPPRTPDVATGSMPHRAGQDRPSATSGRSASAVCPAQLCSACGKRSPLRPAWQIHERQRFFGNAAPRERRAATAPRGHSAGHPWRHAAIAPRNHGNVTLWWS